MTNPPDRLTRRAAERILDHRGDPLESVSRIVDAASATGSATGPATGEEQAAALFRAATGHARVAAAGGASVMTRLSRKLAALPAAGIAAGALVLGGGGLAIAATQGAVDVPFTGHDHRSDHAPAAPSSTNPGLSRTPGASTGTKGAQPPATRLPSGRPSPSVTGLCRAFQAGAVPHQASNPAFAALAAAAGSPSSVGSYCSALIGTSSKPTHPSSGATATHPAPRATPTHPAPAATPTHPAAPNHEATPPVPRPTRATSPIRPAKPTQAVTPTRPPPPTHTAHE